MGIDPIGTCRISGGNHHYESGLGRLLSSAELNGFEGEMREIVQHQAALLLER